MTFIKNLRVYGAGVLCAALCMMSSLSTAEQNLSNQPVYLIDQYLNLLVDAPKSSEWGDVIGVNALPSKAKATSTWRLQRLANGNYRLKNGKTGLFLTSTSTNEWSSVSTAKLRVNWTSMQWKLEAVGAGTFRLKNVWSGLYLNSPSSPDDALRTARLRKDWFSMIFELTEEFDVPSINPVQGIGIQ